MSSQDLVIEILQDVIGTRGLQAHSRFLDVGGNSLNLFEVLKKITDQTGVTLGPRLFFDPLRSSVADISAAIDEQLPNDTSGGVRLRRSALDSIDI